MAKCVRPARLFVARLLDALRAMTRMYTKVTPDMKKDLLWFQEYMAQWNGINLIPNTQFDANIVVDACGSGIGGSDGVRAYALGISPPTDPVQKYHRVGGIQYSGCTPYFSHRC